MKHLFKTGFTIVLFCQLAFSLITNLTLNKSTPYLPSDSLSLQFNTTSDTVKGLVYLETASSSSGLDNNDLPLFNMLLIDNNSVEKSFDQGSIPIDGNMQAGIIYFSPGKLGLAPGLYYIKLADPGTELVDSFRVIAPSNPYRTISGTVIPPEGVSAANMLVKVDDRNLDYSLECWTDVSGNYSIAIDQETFNITGGKFYVRVDKNLPGYILDPIGQNIDCSSGNKENITFKFINASIVVKGTVSCGIDPVKNIQVGLYSMDYNVITTAITDSTGSYSLNCTPGVYLVRISMDQNSGYLSLGEKKVDVTSVQSLVADFKLLKADSYIYGRVTIKGQAPGVSIYVNAYNQNFGGNRSATETSGYFKIPVSTAVDTFWVSIEKSEQNPVPQNLVLEKGNTSILAKAGDSVKFNFIDKPAGGISGSITNQTGFTVQKIFVMLHDTANSGGDYNFESTQTGSYVFDGIPQGIYYAEGGLVLIKDSSTIKVWKKFATDSGKIIPITVGTTVTNGISWIFTANDTVNQQGTINGKGILKLTLIDSTKVSIEKVGVMFFDHIPSAGENIQPVRYYGMQTISPVMQINDIPNKSLYVAVEMFGRINGISVRYFAFAKDGDSPKLLNFQTADTQSVSLMISSKDTSGSIGGTQEPTGNGFLKGKITYTGTLNQQNLIALLYDINNGKVVRMVPMNDSGFYFFEKIAAGKYRVAAAIDTNSDKNPEAMTLHDSTLVFTDSEVYKDINITLLDRKTGTGGVSGTLVFSGTLPSSYRITVSAIMIDTLLPDSAQLNDLAFMLSYHAVLNTMGNFSIGNLPDGVYAIAANAEIVSDSVKDNKEFAFGLYGDFLENANVKLPFKPKYVIVKNGQITGSISLNLISKELIEKSPVINVSTKIPKAYVFQASRLNNTTGVLTVMFAVPVNTTLNFSIIDLNGRVLAQLKQQAFQTGYHTFNWNLKNSGHIPAAGTYIVSMRNSRFNAQRIVKMIR